VADDAERGHHANLSDIAQPDVTTTRRVQQQVADAADAAVRLGRAPDDHVEDLLVLEQAAHLHA